MDDSEAMDEHDVFDDGVAVRGEFEDDFEDELASGLSDDESLDLDEAEDGFLDETPRGKHHHYDHGHS